MLVQCEAPEGVGGAHSVVLFVDGVPSAPYPNGTVSYGPPTLSSLTVRTPHSLEGDGSVGTVGGTVVVITGVNFGPSSGLQPPALGRVTYSPSDLAVAAGVEVCSESLCRGHHGLRKLPSTSSFSFVSGASLLEMLVFFADSCYLPFPLPPLFNPFRPYPLHCCGISRADRV